MECDPNLDVLLQFRRNIQKILYKTPCLSQEEKHACNPRTRSCLNMGLAAEKNSNPALQVSNYHSDGFLFRNVYHLHSREASASRGQCVNITNLNSPIQQMFTQQRKSEKNSLISPEITTIKFKEYCWNAK